MPTYSANQYLVDWFSATGLNPTPRVNVAAALPAGSNNIGDVDVLSIADGDNNIGNVDLASAIPAGTAEIGKVTTNIEPPLQWPPISGDGRALLYGTIAQTAVGTTQLVGTDSDELYYIASYVVVLDVAGTFKFTDGTADLCGAIPADANGGAVVLGMPFAPLFKTGATSRPINIVTTGGKAFGHFAYYKATS